VGLATAGGLAEIAAGVLGTVATWVASTGSRAAGREAQTPRLVGACESQARGFGGGALRCRACCDHASGEGGGQLRAARGGWLVRYQGVNDLNLIRSTDSLFSLFLGARFWSGHI
jgi:hypothetical protein